MTFRSFGPDEFLFLLTGLQWTVLLTAIALIGGGIAGFLIALARVSTIKWLRVVAGTYIQIIQGIPVLMILFLSYYGLSLAGFDLHPLIAAGASMSIYASGYLAEIWRGCIQSVPKQQWEASESLAMTRAPAVSLCDPAAGCPHFLAVNGGFRCAGRQEHLDRVDYRLCRTGPGRHAHQQCNVPTIPRFCGGRSALFRCLLPIVIAIALAGKEAQCLKSSSIMFTRASAMSKSSKVSRLRLNAVKFCPHRSLRLGKKHIAALHQRAREDQLWRDRNRWS